MNTICWQRTLSRSLMQIQTLSEEPISRSLTQMQTLSVKKALTYEWTFIQFRYTKRSKDLSNDKTWILSTSAGNFVKRGKKFRDILSSILIEYEMLHVISVSVSLVTRLMFCIHTDMFVGVRTRGLWRSEKTSLMTRGDSCRKNGKTGDADYRNQIYLNNFTYHLEVFSANFDLLEFHNCTTSTL